MKNPRSLFAIFCALAVAGVTAVVWLEPFSPSFMELGSPTPGTELRIGAVEVLVGFRGDDRVAHETFRCRLNGHDVTAELTLGRNGAGGSLIGLVEGPNQLELSVFGRRDQGSEYVEETQRVEIRLRPPTDLDRAGMRGSRRTS